MQKNCSFVEMESKIMTKKFIGQALASAIVCAVAAIAGVAMMVMAGSAIKEEK